MAADADNLDANESLSHSATLSYLGMLDAALRTGLAGLSDAFVDAQVRFVAACQQPDGGFRGRQGGSDVYYTDFALRCLALLAPKHCAFSRVENYLSRQARRPTNVVECFSILNIRRILGLSKGTVPFSSDEPRGSPLAIRSTGDQHVSAYHTFLGALCFQMLGESMPAAEDAVRTLGALGRPDGGYAERAGQAESQTSATAAAVAFLTMHDALSSERVAGAMRFLAGMQSTDGGLKPHAAVAAGDLLSTFTGLVTLAALGGLGEVDMSRVARFLQSTALPAGGFLACPGDDTADVEYTYYGLGVLAMLRTLRS